jgi:uncharacterized repeat protein (TIGR01451 family)
MRRSFVRLAILAIALIGLHAAPAAANHIDHAIAGATCTGYGIFVDGGELNVPGAIYAIGYRIFLVPPTGPPITVDGGMFVTPDANQKFTATDAKTWESLGIIVNSTYNMSGVAGLLVNGELQNLIGVTFVNSTLDCPPPPPPPPHLTVAKNPKDGTFTEGSQVTFTIQVGNDGGSPATNVHLHDQLPGNGGLVWASATPTQGSCFVSPANVLDCELGTINAGGSVLVTVMSTGATPRAACQLQPNPVALATADGGLTAQDSGGLSCTPPPLPCPAGSFTFSVDAAGNLNIIFDQFPAPNDNSYGVNAVGWGSHAHRFSDLVGSDHAGFQLVDPGGVVRLSFNLDYISANTNAPSGYASLGPFGGDGKVLVGTLTTADIAWSTSLANNLNNVNIPGLFNASHVQQFGSVNLLLDSPPTDPQHLTYSNTDPLLGGWDFHDTYYASISAAKLLSLGFNLATWRVEPNLSALHNSPAKVCPPPDTGGPGLSVIKTEVKDKQVKVTVMNTGPVDEVVTAVQLTWPAVNGKLMQVKLDGDVIYDNPDIAPPSANLTLAQLVADANKRKIQHGTSDVLTFIFEKNANTTLSTYTGSMSTSGFGLPILP